MVEPSLPFLLGKPPVRERLVRARVSFGPYYCLSTVSTWSTYQRSQCFTTTTWNSYKRGFTSLRLRRHVRIRKRGVMLLFAEVSNAFSSSVALSGNVNDRRREEGLIFEYKWVTKRGTCLVEKTCKGCSIPLISFCIYIFS